MRKTYYEIDPDKVDWESFCEIFNSIVDILEEDNDLQTILTPLGKLAKNIFIYDRIVKSMEIYSNQVNTVLSENKYTGAKFAVAEHNLIEQFTYSSDRPEAENIANAMYLANAIARTFRDNKDELEKNDNVGLTSQQLNDIIGSLFTIKEQCLRRLIQIRNELGDNSSNKKIAIQFAYTKSADYGLYFVHISGYLEPFVLQCQEVNSDEMSYPDTVAFFESEDSYLNSIAPIKIKGSKTNINALFTFAKNTIRGGRYKGISDRVVNGVEAYFKMQVEYGDIFARYINDSMELIRINREIAILETQLSKTYVYKKAEKQKLMEALKLEKESLTKTIENYSKEVKEKLD